MWCKALNNDENHSKRQDQNRDRVEKQSVASFGEGLDGLIKRQVYQTKPPGRLANN